MGKDELEVLREKIAELEEENKKLMQEIEFQITHKEILMDLNLSATSDLAVAKMNLDALSKQIETAETSNKSLVEYIQEYEKEDAAVDSL